MKLFKEECEFEECSTKCTPQWCCASDATHMSEEICASFYTPSLVALCDGGRPSHHVESKHG